MSQERTTVNATKLLRSQHDDVASLFNELESAENAETRRRLFEEISDKLAVHTTIEERVFYPAVYVGELKDFLKEAVEEHLSAKRMIAELLKMDLDDEEFVPKVKVLQELIEHHVDEEETELFPKVNANFADVELEALRDEMEATRESFQRGEPRKRVPTETDAAAPLT